MQEISRLLFLAGALPFVVLGLAHALATPRTPDQKRGLSPRDPTLRDAMTRDTLLLTRRTSLWLAWVGFNFSHSLGAVLFGVVVLLIGRSQATFNTQAPVFLPLAILVSGLYLYLGIRYWFRTPIVGINLSRGQESRARNRHHRRRSPKVASGATSRMYGSSLSAEPFETWQS